MEVAVKYLVPESKNSNIVIVGKEANSDEFATKGYDVRKLV